VRARLRGLRSPKLPANDSHRGVFPYPEVIEPLCLSKSSRAGSPLGQVPAFFRSPRLSIPFFFET